MGRRNDIETPGVLFESKVVDFAKLRDGLTFASENRWLHMNTQLAFETYRWMLSSADERGKKWAESDRYASRRYPDILAVIGGEGVGGVNVTQTARFGPRWRQDLSKRLLRALCSDVGVVARWRAEQGINPNGRRRIPVLVYNNPLGPPGDRLARWGVGEAGVAKAIDALFELWSPERRLVEPLNRSHPDALRVTRLGFGVADGRWYAAMEYGVDGSSWSSAHRGYDRRLNPLAAVQRPGEPFYDFIVRARRHLARILTPGCAWRRRPGYRSAHCNDNWTGTTSEGVEIVGGCVLAEHVRVWKSSGIGPGPVLLKGETLPRVVDEEDGKKLVLSDRSWPMRRALGDDEYLEGRVRFELRLEAYRKAYLDLGRDERSLVDKFLAPTQNGWGSAIREHEEALRYLDNVRAVPFEGWCPAGAEAKCEP